MRNCSFVFSGVLRSALLAVLVVYGWCGQRAAGQVYQTLVVPNEFQSASGGSADGLLNARIRQQQVYLNSQFPNHPIRIYEIRFRPWSGAAPFNGDLSRFQITFSTTTRSPDGLDNVFDQNVGSDAVISFDNPINLSSAVVDDPVFPATKRFDIRVLLSVPFRYDPAAGNLLLDIRNFTDLPTGNIADHGASAGPVSARRFVLNPDGTVAEGGGRGVVILQIHYLDALDPGTLLNINFGGGLKTGLAAAGVGSLDAWNAVANMAADSTTFTNLLFWDGSASGASLTVSNYSIVSENGVSDPMFKTFIGSEGGGPLTATVKGLADGSYDFYVYGHGGTDNQNGVFALKTSGQEFAPRQTTVTPAWKATNWIEGAQYVVFTRIRITNGEPVVLTSMRGADGNLSVLNGLQIHVSETRLAVSPSGGLFTNSVPVSLVFFPSDSTVFYTLDGTNPSTNAQRYLNPFTLTNATEIRARIFEGGLPISEVVTSKFQRVYAVNDGVPNSWRQKYFGVGYLTDSRVGAEEDPDQDGATNYAEYVAGTNPLDPNSVLKTSLKTVPGIIWNSIPNVSYRVQRRASDGTNWVNVSPVIRASSTVTQFGDFTATNNAGIYRIQAINP
jgi:hypothetical protein